MYKDVLNLYRLVMMFVLLMDRREEADWRNASRRRETGQCNCVHVYVRIRTSDGAVAGIRSSS
jgi:hypothetical protein